ncbi:MAG: tripartite tricarboxylate transporter TctB family protein [Clostridia bacterium]
MDKANRVIGIIFLVFGILLYIVTPFQTAAISTSKMGPDFFPKVVAIIMVICSVGLIIQATIAMKSKYNAEEEAEVDWQKEKKVALVFAMLIVYVLCIELAGFFISSILFGVALLYVLKSIKWYYYATYITLVAIINYVFSELLYINLP